MRILMVWSENLNKHGSGRTHFLHLARCLAERGHGVRILAPGYPPRTAETLPVPVSYIPVPRRSALSFLLFHALLLLWLPAVILRRRPDVIYSRGLFHSCKVYLLCRLLGVRYVAEVDSIVDEELAMRGRSPWLVRLVRFADRWNLRWASAFVCVTPGLRDELVRRGAKPERVVAIHNGAAADLFTPGDADEARRKLGLPPGEVLIGFVGELAAWQGLDLLVEAAARLPADTPPWRVVIVGDGEMRDSLAAQVAAGNLQERVNLLRGVPHEQVPDYLRAFDLSVIPIHDPRKLRYGLSALKFWETLASGLPTLVPDQGGLGDVLTELNWPGEFPTGDAAALAEHIRQVIADLPALRSRKAEIHEIVRRRHSWAAVAERVEELFRSLLPRKRAS